MLECGKEEEKMQAYLKKFTGKSQDCLFEYTKLLSRLYDAKLTHRRLTNRLCVLIVIGFDEQ